MIGETETTSRAARLRKWRDAARVTWLVIVVAFVTRYVGRHWVEIRDFSSRLSVLTSLAVVITTIAGKYVVSEQARVSTRCLGREFGHLEMFWLYSASDIVKYVPGGIWNALARVKLYADREMTLRGSSRAFGLEKFWQVTGAFFTGIIFLLPTWVDTLDPTTPVDGLPLLMLGWSLTVVAWWLTTAAGSRVIAGVKLSPVVSARALSDQFLVAVLLGLGVWLPWAAITSSAEANMAVAIGAFALGRAAGYVAIFAPAGIGIREVVSLWAMNSIAPSEVATFAVGANRVLTAVADLGGFGVAASLNSFLHRVSSPAESPPSPDLMPYPNSNGSAASIPLTDPSDTDNGDVTPDEDPV
ncbi:MAG TPA: hypothetical protein ENI86_02870 [Acidimicrobiales bacterium]|nr:hypothetical protein [Acidimicrobiales bacterium]